MAGYKINIQKSITFLFSDNKQNILKNMPHILGRKNA